jgi:prepilin-type processing-associated H-X9-DG protein
MDRSNMTFLDGHAETRHMKKVPTYTYYPDDWRLSCTIFWCGKIEASAGDLNDKF